MNAAESSHVNLAQRSLKSALQKIAPRKSTLLEESLSSSNLTILRKVELAIKNSSL